MNTVYSIGDEISSSNYGPCYCNKCDADIPDQCTCKDNSSEHKDAVITKVDLGAMPE